MDTTRIYKSSVIGVILIVALLTTSTFAVIDGGSGTISDPYRVNGCTDITAPGQYIMITDASSTTDCMRILVPNVTFNMNYRTITNTLPSQSDTVEAFVTNYASNLTIRNGKIEGPWYAGIYSVFSGGNVSFEDINIKDTQMYSSVLIVPDPNTPTTFTLQNINAYSYSSNIVEIPQCSNYNSKISINGGSYQSYQGANIVIPYQSACSNSGYTGQTTFQIDTSLIGSYGTGLPQFTTTVNNSIEAFTVAAPNTIFSTLASAPAGYDLVAQRSIWVGYNKDMITGNYEPNTTDNMTIYIGTNELTHPTSVPVVGKWNGTAWEMLPNTTTNITLNETTGYWKVTFPVERADSVSTFTSNGADTYYFAKYELFTESSGSITDYFNSSNVVIKIIQDSYTPAKGYNITVLSPIPILHTYLFSGITDSAGIANFSLNQSTMDSLIDKVVLVRVYDPDGNEVKHEFIPGKEFMEIMLNPSLDLGLILEDTISQGYNLFLFLIILQIIFVAEFSVAEGLIYGGVTVEIFLILLLNVIPGLYQFKGVSLNVVIGIVSLVVGLILTSAGTQDPN